MLSSEDLPQAGILSFPEIKGSEEISSKPHQSLWRCSTLPPQLKLQVVPASVGNSESRLTPSGKQQGFAGLLQRHTSAGQVECYILKYFSLHCLVPISSVGLQLGATHVCRERQCSNITCCPGALSAIYVQISHFYLITVQKLFI